MSAIANEKSPELAVAEELIGGLAAESVETRVERDRILVRLRKQGWKLTQLVFSIASLRNLATDRHREVKIEYLEREIAEAARERRTYAYPRNLARCA